MIAKKLLIILSAVTYSLSCVAQKEYNVWVFGNSAGVDFNSGSPVAVTGTAISTTEGSSSVADTNGTLLFYSDGITVWNRNHVAMPNGTGLYGGASSTQSALIIRQPGSLTIYYIFTSAEAKGGNGFCYSVVDMSLQSGLGDVTVKNVQLFTLSAEKVTGVFHSNGTDVWIVGHGMGNDTFYAYKLTSAGLNAVPVTSNVGEVHNIINGAEIGYMKISPDGTRLALAIRYQYYYQLFKFDASTGIVSDPMTIPSNGTRCYGVEFSPDNSKLYLSDDAGLYQYDLSSNDSNLIKASRVTITTTNTWAVQLAPDKKIYCVRFSSSYLDVINSPNLPGASCNWQTNAVNLLPGYGQLGLPNRIPDFDVTVLPPVANLTSSDTAFCEESGKCIDFYDNSTRNPTAWKWLFPGAIPDTSTAQNPTGICYFSSGTYAVTLIASNVNGSDTLTISPMIIFGNTPPAPTITITGGDTLVCSNAATYQWFYNGAPVAGATNSFFVAVNDGSYNVYITDSIGCTRFGNGILFTSVNSLSAFSEMTIYPNPTNGNFEVSFTSAKSTVIKVKMVNMLGEDIFENEYAVRAGLNTIPVAADGVRNASGVYILRLIYNGEVLNRKIFIEK